jgi:hypothetical protein
MTAQEPLRLWPGVVAVTVQWLLWYTPCYHGCTLSTRASRQSRSASVNEYWIRD